MKVAGDVSGGCLETRTEDRQTAGGLLSFRYFCGENVIPSQTTDLSGLCQGQYCCGETASL